MGISVIGLFYQPFEKTARMIVGTNVPF